MSTSPVKSRRLYRFAWIIILNYGKVLKREDIGASINLPRKKRRIVRPTYLFEPLQIDPNSFWTLSSCKTTTAALVPLHSKDAHTHVVVRDAPTIGRAYRYRLQPNDIDSEVLGCYQIQLPQTSMKHYIFVHGVSCVISSHGCSLTLHDRPHRTDTISHTPHPNIKYSKIVPNQRTSGGWSLQ